MMIRRATAADIDLLVRLRMGYLSEHGAPDEEMRETLRNYFEKRIDSDDFVALVAERDGMAVSTAFMTVAEPPPRSLTTGRTGTVYNVYTVSGFRRQGFAGRVMRELLDEACRMGVSSIDLLASEEGQALYEKLGFATPDYTFMRLKL